MKSHQKCSSPGSGKVAVKQRRLRHKGPDVRIWLSLLLVLSLVSHRVLAQSSTPSDVPLTPCPVCAIGGEPVPFPDKPFSFADLPVTTCGELESFMAPLDGVSSDCRGLQTLGPFCGCPTPPDSCSLCPKGEPVPHPDNTLIFLTESFSCGIAEAITASNPGALYGVDDSVYCLLMQYRSGACGCKPGWLQIVLPWTFRIYGMLSLLGSSLIVFDILKKERKKKGHQRFTAYHQLILGISFFDCISSGSLALATMMASIDSGLYQARGNDATCKAQGVLIQIGMTSIFYNMSLSIYFWLVICRNWKEHQFQRILLWVHLSIWTVGFTLGFASLPYVGPVLSNCGLMRPPGVATLWPVNIFFTIPVCLVLIVSTLATGAICRNVYMQQKKAQKWMADRNMELTRKVFWQSFWYLLAFYCTIPWLLVGYYVEVNSATEFMVIMFSFGFLNPSQGVLNALVFFQRQRGWGTKCRWCVGKGTKKAKPTKIERRHDANASSVTTVDSRESHPQVSGSLNSIGASKLDDKGQARGTEGRDNPGSGSDEKVEMNQKQLNALDVAHVEEGDAEAAQISQRYEESGHVESEAVLDAVTEYWELNKEEED